MLLWNFSFEFGCFYYLKIFYWNISTVDWNLDKKCLGLYEPQLKFLFDIRIDSETKKQHAGTLHLFLQRILCQENLLAHLSVSFAFSECLLRSKLNQAMWNSGITERHIFHCSFSLFDTNSRFLSKNSKGLLEFELIRSAAVYSFQVQTSICWPLF